MDVGTAMSVAQTLFAALQNSQLNEICFIAGYKSQLGELRHTVDKIKAVLHDAESKQKLNEQEKHYIEDLMDIVYEADDLFDEFVALAEQKKLNKGVKVRFYSLFNKFGPAYKMAEGVKKIKKKLDAIAYNSQFSFNIDPKPQRNRRPVTCSYVYEADIIGREADLEKITSVLLDSHVQHDVSFLSIVGIGGLGKTAISQLVYNDERVKDAFPSRLWTCVADEGQKQLNIERLIHKIYASIIGKMDEGFTYDKVQSLLRQHLAGGKYLLVLDDVWTEDRVQWGNLVGFLMGGPRGSWVLVTTRSGETARIVGGGPTHQLLGLSKENSWRLFEKTAFGSEQFNPPEDLVKIGREIVEKCANVPLAIRVVGSLLYGQGQHKWLLFQKLGLAKIVKEDENGIMPILKLSYYHLESPLKCCFSYCALFPKDYEIDKAKLIRLWIAQGFIPLDDRQSMEDVAEEYFSILLRRCFFQDVKKDMTGLIYKFKLHDLMHDVAQEVVGNEICTQNTINEDMDEKVHHLSFISGIPANYALSKTRLRSYVRIGPQLEDMNQFTDAVLVNLKYLRALGLASLCIKSLPSSIGELLHLRYLDLSYNESMEVLPEEITKLYNLQTLLLRSCKCLKGLPKDMCKLVKLRVLDLDNCNSLTHMPKGMGELIWLYELPIFVVGESSSWKKWFDKLEDLRALRNLKGYLEIRITQYPSVTAAKLGTLKGNGENGGCLSNKEYLNVVELDFNHKKAEGTEEYDEAVMEEMRPHSSLMKLIVKGYNGARMPRWVREDNLATFLPNLVDLRLCGGKLKHLGWFGNLRSLKVLEIKYMPNLKYISECCPPAGSCSMSSSTAVRNLSSNGERFSAFPSLERLRFEDLPELKGWWRESSTSTSMTQLLLSQLKNIYLSNCPNLTAILGCPILEGLNMKRFNTRLQIITAIENGKAEATSSSTKTKIAPPSFGKLMRVTIDNVAWLNSLCVEAFQNLEVLSIRQDKEVENLGEVEEVFRICSSSLQNLIISYCGKLRSVFRGLEYLTALKGLAISHCDILNWSEKEEGEYGSSTLWESRVYSLSYLSLRGLPKLVNLPDWIQYLTALQTLQIWGCPSLESLPQGMTKLTSLRKLQLLLCSSRLQGRCQIPTGEDWPHIQHIPSIEFQ